MRKTLNKPYMKRLTRALKHLFVALHALSIMSILFASALFYIAFRPDGLALLNTTVLTPLGIGYTSAEGSLSQGVTLHNFHTQSIDAKTLTLDYNLTAILKGEHVVDSIRIDGLRIELDDFINDDDTPTLPLPVFALKEVILTNLQLMSTYPIELDIHGENGSFDGKNLNFKTLTASARTQYASGALKGTLKNNSISGTGIVYPNAIELDPYIKDFVTLPTSQPIDILELSDSKVRLTTNFNTLTANFDPKISLNTAKVAMDYHYTNNYIDFTALYTLIRDTNHLKTSQKLRYNFDGVTATTFEGTFLASEFPLPSNTITGSFRDDSEGVAGKLSIAQTSLLLQSGDYENYKWHFTTLNDTLDFLPMLPEALRQSPLSGSAQGNYQLSSTTLSGIFDAHHNHADMNGTLLFQNDKLQLNAKMLLPPDAPTWKEWSMKPPHELDFALTQEGEKTHLSLNGKDFALHLQHHNELIQGSGNYLGSFFDINGTKNDSSTSIILTTLTPSLNQTLKRIPSISLPETGYYDAEIRTSTHILYDTALHIDTTVEIPWYVAVLDSKRQYNGTNNMLSLHYSDTNNTIIIDKYLLDILNHSIASERPSHLHLDSLGNLVIDEVWIFDNLRLDGNVDTRTLATALTLKSDKFSYKGPEGEAHAAVDLHYEHDDNATQKLSGNITVLDGKITYLPLQQFKVMDDDVIIVQDVTAPSKSSLAVEIKIDSLKPINYLTKELNIHLTPDFTLWKDPQKDIQILGMVTLPNGTITTSGKIFTLRPSHLYFGGEIPINPYLDITVDHEVDYKKIQIYITHRLDSPIILFSSDPVMSQNDIMSYILFGASSGDTFNNGSNVAARADATNFMLGAGLKGLIGGATKLQIDTMNILTTKEGGMGFEVGARLNKDLRVLYKNDTVSSVLLQYTVNRWLRLDADIHELGQGINAIYIKDFRDFLPHNPPKKVNP